MDSNLFIPTDAEGSHGVAGCRTEGSRRFDVRREKEGGAAMDTLTEEEVS